MRENTCTAIRPPDRMDEGDPTERRDEVSEFLDRNGYTAREIRGIAREAILRWEAQKK